MVRIKPFNAIRPPANLAPRVASVPYDVVSTDEARALAQDNPDSFLHVLRPEIDLPDGTELHDDAVYDQAARSLDALLDRGALIRDDGPGLYLYRQVWQGRSQIGLVCCCHVSDYEAGHIRKHERTRPDKEDDRTRHVLTLDANAGPIFLTFRDDDRIALAMQIDSGHRPIQHFVAPDGVTHTVWSIENPQPYIAMFDAMDAVYVADGHHRTASAARAARTRGEDNPHHTGEEEYNWFLSVLFPASQLTILPYNRVVTDLGSLDPASFLDALRGVGTIEEAAPIEPERTGEFSVYCDGRWWRLTIDPGSIDSADPIASLDVSLLQDRVLSPMLGISDPRVDPRIGFVGGVRGAEELARRVDQGAAAAAFMLHATSIEQLLAVSDAGMCMPPKSTWFEPKLRSGLFVHALDSKTAGVSS